MSDSAFNLRCPKLYGDIRFVVIGTTQASAAWCPVSGKPNCVDCDVINHKEFVEGEGEVKRKESK